MSIRFRLAAMCLVIALLPAIPVSILVSNLLEKSFNVGLSETMEDALDSGITVSRKHLEGLRLAFEEETGRVIALFPVGSSAAVSVGFPVASSATSSRAISEAVPDSSQIAMILSEPASHGIDGFIIGKSVPQVAAQDTAFSLPRELFSYSTVPAFTGLTENMTVIERAACAGYHPDLAFYETENRAVQFALWSPPRSSSSLLLYKRIDPEFVVHAERLLAVRQLFAQLRLSQGRLNRSFFYPFISIYAVILLLSLCFAFLMSERLVAPIRRLVAATSAVASGDWRIQLTQKGGGEIGRLVESFNRMVGRLDAQRRRLIDLEKMASWREMARHLAHEIKNPLLPIRLTVQEMKDQYSGDDEHYRLLLSESVRVVEDELNHLQKLVKEFSSFARMPGLSLVAGSVEQLVRDVARLYPQIETSIEVPPALPGSVFDLDQLRRVFINLFDNSLSMFPQGHKGRIQIRIRRQGETIVLDFGDNGPGIPTENISKIFDPYFSTRKGGTGLGLAMVKNIILLHGGTIEAFSRENEGALFTITLPTAGPSV